MAEQNLIERLDQAVEAMLAGLHEEAHLVEPSLATLLVLAGDLRDLPDPSFKARLKAELIPSTSREEIMSTSATLKAGFHTVTPYFVVHDAAELIRFLEQAFGGKEQFRAARPDGTIQHAEVKIGDSLVELGQATTPTQLRAFGIHLYVENADAVYERAVRAGATSMQAPTDQFYGDREAAVKDPFGNHWYIATHQDPAVGPIRKGFRAVTPYLHPRGADRLMEFLKQAFDAKAIEEPATRPDGTIMHAAVRIGDSIAEMGEAHGEWQPMQSAIHLYVDDADAVYERALRAGAVSLEPPTDRPYGERSAFVRDPFGNDWFIATPRRKRA